MKAQKETEKKVIRKLLDMTFTTSPEVDKYRDPKYESPKLKKLREEIADDSITKR